MSLSSPKIKSKYKENEEFTFRDTPKNFNSVTNASIRKLNKYCLKNNERVFKDKYEPGALKAMLTAVAGQFNFAHRRLEGDYASRKGKLETAYIDGLAEIKAKIVVFKLQVAVHNELFERYSRANEKINGDRLPTNLRYDESDLAKIEKQYEELRSK